MDSLSYPGANQSFTYNSLWQLTGDATTQYTYPAGQNNGRISQSIDRATGQTVNYTYDSLNRLATAQATDVSWGNAYSYDGFGNLTAKTVIAGSAPSFSESYDLTTNRGGGAYGGAPYDANGNSYYGPYDVANGAYVQYTYDVENRLVSAGSNGGSYTGYGFDPQGKRILTQTSALGAPALNGTPNPVKFYTFTFYGITGQRLSTFGVITSAYYNSGYCNGAPVCSGAPFGGYLYFGGKLIAEPSGSGVLTDRLGSVRSGISYYPWGEEKTSSQDGQVKFATYFRDMPGQDYADQRYYTATAGRFYTPDPKGMNAVNLKNPASWNMYTYAMDDRVNHFDPSGLDYCDPNFGCDFSDPLGFDESSAPTGQVGPVYYGDCAVLAFGEAPGVPCIYDGMGGVVPGPPTASAPPTCEETETAYVSAYLAQRSSPLAADAGLIVTYSDTKVIDDEFIVALAGAESSYGKSQQNSPTWGFYNAFSNAAHCQALAANSDCYKVNPYNSYEDAITDAINLLTGAKYLVAA